MESWAAVRGGVGGETGYGVQHWGGLGCAVRVVCLGVGCCGKGGVRKALLIVGGEGEGERGPISSQL